MKNLSNELLSLHQSTSPLYAALQTLSEKERIALFLRYWGPCSILEISRNLHLSWSQADKLLEECLNKLRIEFRRRGLLHLGQSPFFPKSEKGIYGNC